LYSDVDVDINVKDCTLSSNTASYGGAVYIADGTLAIGTSTVTGNTAGESGGGIYQAAGTVTIASSTFDYNDANGGGGEGGGAVAILEGTLNIVGSLLTLNDAVGNDGGGVLVDQGSTAPAVVNLIGSMISDSTAYDWGGGIACHRACTITATDSHITGNTADEGGGILLRVLSPDTGTFTCTGIAGTGTGVYANTATNTSTHVGGGIDLLEDGASATSSNCNWGSGGSDNSPSDVAGGSYHRTDFGADASFSCSYTGCL
ncbi:MAG: hypothetical protein JRJ84_10945, partial [Deltaproteobacteria bacterium]|nr:hypothetical protein [Deltaproteobacteria bacterium]